jgi:dolichol kinase
MRRGRGSVENMVSEQTLEVRRQFFHMILGSCIGIAVYFLKPMYGNLILVPLVAALAILFFTSNFGREIVVSRHLIMHFEREKDAKKFPFKGAIHYGVGIFFPILLLSTEKACMIIFILSVGDAMSTLIGKFYGSHRIGDKSIEGFIAFVLSSFIACAVFIILIGRPDLVGLAGLLCVVGAFVEFQGFIDDNLMVPLVLAIMAWMQAIL